MRFTERTNHDHKVDAVRAKEGDIINGIRAQLGDWLVTPDADAKSFLMNSSDFNTAYELTTLN